MASVQKRRYILGIANRKLDFNLYPFFFFAKINNFQTSDTSRSLKLANNDDLNGAY